MKTIILAGGLGTRLSEFTFVVPKPMVEVGGKPCLYHVMNHYARYGHNDFLLALGYKSEVIKKYFIEKSSFIWFILSTGNIPVASTTGRVLCHYFMKPISIDVTQQHREEDEQRKLRPKRQSVTSKLEYLLFLKKRKDGLYESVSGQMDLGLSVRALFELRSPR